MVKLKLVVVEIEAPRWVKRLSAGLLAGVLALGASTMVRADVVFSDYQPGDLLTAKDLNDRFNALKNAVNKPTVTINNIKFGTSGTFKGVTKTSHNGKWSTAGLQGLAAGKRLCENDYGATAHVCSASDVSRNIQAGFLGASALPAGGAWYSSMAYFEDDRSYDLQGNSKGAIVHHECDAFTSAAYSFPLFSSGNALVVKDGIAVAWNASCNDSLPILCCD